MFELKTDTAILRQSHSAPRCRCQVHGGNQNAPPSQGRRWAKISSKKGPRVAHQKVKEAQVFDHWEF